MASTPAITSNEVDEVRRAAACLFAVACAVACAVAAMLPARADFPGIGREPSVSNLTELQAASSFSFPFGVWLLTYGSGIGAPPLFYQPSASACSLNAGAGDNGS